MKIFCKCIYPKPERKRNKKTEFYHCLNCGHKILLLPESGGTNV